MVEPRHHVLRRLLRYWLDKRGERFAPARRDIDPAGMRDLLPHLFLVDVEAGAARFRYRLVGTDIVQSFGMDMTGRYVEDLDAGDRAPSVDAHYAAVVASRQPSCQSVQFTRGVGRYVAYERLILPLSSDLTSVDMLLGGLCFDEAYDTGLSPAARRVGG